MSIERLLSAADRTARLADKLGQQFAEELAAVLRSVERRLRPLLTETATGSRTALIRAAQANRTRKALEQILTDAGYDDLAASAYGERLDQIVDSVLRTRRLAQQAAKLTDAFDQRVSALKLLHETDLLDEGQALSRELWQAVTRGTFGAQSVDKILDDLSQIIDATAPQIRTLYDTSVSILGRQVEALQAGNDPDTVFAYMGPADAKTREFCLEHVGKVYTRAEIDELDNGQIDNVFLTAGGYNCRHVWTEVSQFSALQPYVSTGQRIPEVQAQLKEAA